LNVDETLLGESAEELYESAPCGYISTLPDGRIVRVNQTFLDWTGYRRERLTSSRFSDLLNPPGKIFHETHYAPLLEMQGFAYEIAFDLVCADGRLLPVLLNTVQKRDVGGAPVLRRTTVFNATDRRRYEYELLEARRRAERAAAELKRLNDTLAERVEAEVAERLNAEEALRQAQKMEAVGRLAGGIAHDFNNLLSVILGYAHLLQGSLDGDPRYGGDLREIRTAGERAASLTRQLLAFSRQQVLDPRVLDLAEVVRNLEPMLRRIVGEDIEITVGEQPVLGRVKADPGQLEQVLMNLVVNSRDAMPTGGKLTIEIANVVLDDEYATHHLGVVAGPHVMLAVSDNGVGMDRATAARIFEPFFTTKEKGKGTGLGLSTVFGIVQQSGGTIWVYSEPGAGTTFKIYLPMTTDDAALLREPDRAGKLGGSETILLAEDEEQVRVMVATILRRQGYTVLEARDAMAAIHHAGHHGGAIHLLLTDVVMPDIGGRSLAEQIGALRPGLRVLYVSGYTDDAVVRHGVLEADVAFLQKPITPDALARKVREVLDGPLPGQNA
jgi:PAS domain S-box-containing protein